MRGCLGLFIYRTWQDIFTSFSPLFQLDLARKHIDYHRDKFGYSQSNVDFVFGYIEKLAEAGLQDSTFDIIM